ncbi:hypothetical protein ACIBUY_06135 [Streptomyces sp. NPDC050085]|uniref:hypothetical protein n=1 Tax=Streptomyces sp. NPDC050085 TaxID=3365600 RepID=UPI0037B27CAF
MRPTARNHHPVHGSPGSATTLPHQPRRPQPAAAAGRMIVCGDDALAERLARRGLAELLGSHQPVR